MAWDTTEPQDTTKIRDLGTVIRPNWVAIDQAESTFTPIAFNFANRTPDPAANDPAAIADAYILYCKDDSTGAPELFGIDENSVISQFTSTDQTLAQNGHAVIPPGILINWGRSTLINGNATIAATFTRNFSAAPWVIHCTPYDNLTPSGGSNSREIGADTFAVGGFNVRCFGGNVTQNVVVGWIAIGAL